MYMLVSNIYFIMRPICSIDVSFTQLLILTWKYLWQIFHMKRTELMFYQKMLHRVTDLQMFLANSFCSQKDPLQILKLFIRQSNS